MSEDTEAGTTEQPQEGVRFETLLDRIEEIVSALESGRLSLEESLELFEEGMALVKRADEVLRNAEAKVEILLSGPGGDTTEPFEVPGEEP